MNISSSPHNMPPPPRVRTMGSGRCTAVVAVGSLGLKCPCLRGVFGIRFGALNDHDMECQLCLHSISQHKDISSDPVHESSQTVEAADLRPKGRLSIADNPFICPRTDTVQKLAEMLDLKRVVHVRGTPSSGKTTLAYLLGEYYANRGEPVVSIIGWHNINDPVAHFISKCEAQGYDGIDAQTLFKTNIVYLIDEAQQSYRDLSLWLGIIKTQSGSRSGPRICIFSSYGSPTTGPTQYPVGSTPAKFGASQRVSITLSEFAGNGQICLFYSREEFEDAVTRLCSDPIRTFELDYGAREYLYSITNGHPGAVNGLIEFIFMTYRSDLKNHVIEHVTMDHLTQALDDERKVFKMLEECPVQRSFPPLERLPAEAAGVLRVILQYGSIPCRLENPGIRLCYEEGWVHSEALDSSAKDIVCVLPSRLHEKFVECHLSLRDPRPFPFEKFPSLDVFCEAMLRKFSRTRLLLSRSGRLGASGQVRSPEAQFRDEWYCAFNSLVGHGIAISSEWARPGGERINFRIAEPAWGIELLKDGDRLSEHCGRFLEGGIYYQWIVDGLIKDWIVIDCRHSHPQKYQTTGTKLWRVIFHPDYSSAYVLDSNNLVVISKFPLAD